MVKRAFNRRNEYCVQWVSEWLVSLRHISTGPTDKVSIGVSESEDWWHHLRGRLVPVHEVDPSNTNIGWVHVVLASRDHVVLQNSGSERELSRGRQKSGAVHSAHQQTNKHMHSHRLHSLGEKCLNKKLSYCWDSSHYDNITDRGRSANPNHNPKYDLCKFYLTNRVLSTRGILYPVLLCQLTRWTISTACLMNNVLIIMSN